MRTTNFPQFAQLLNEKMKQVRSDFNNIHMPRVYRIEADKAGGDVIVVLESPDWKSKKAVVYKSDGSWTAPFYWSEGQI